MTDKSNSWYIAVDTGGTFTDCIVENPDGDQRRIKVLSNGSLRGIIKKKVAKNCFTIEANWPTTENIFNGYTLEITSLEQKCEIVETDLVNGKIWLDQDILEDLADREFQAYSGEEAPTLAARIATGTNLNESLPKIQMRLGTTKGTNALLERKGANVIFLITKGFKDLLKIGTQQRPDLFCLDIRKAELFHKEIIEVNERIDTDGNVLEPLTDGEVQRVVSQVKELGYNSLAIALLNSYVNPIHEERIKEALVNAGLSFISTSHEIAPVIKVLPRAQTTVINSYLNDLMDRYLNSITNKMAEGDLKVMTSSGGLVSAEFYAPKDSLLSGPAGGVVGAGSIGKRHQREKLLTFDMGGTSTDVARWQGSPEYRYDSHVGEAQILVPSVAIHTVAAGGGSICSYDGFKFTVGPDSAGAFPGPASYGFGGPLAITDVNLLLGRLDSEKFGIPVNEKFAQLALEESMGALDEESEFVLDGFLKIANESMAEAIRKISVKRGYDPQEHAMIAFGGAGAQHACGVASLLDIPEIIVPYDAGILSAYGIQNAPIVRYAEQQILERVQGYALQKKFDLLDEKALEKLYQAGYTIEQVAISKRVAFLRFQGQDATIEVDFHDNEQLIGDFRGKYERLFGHWVHGREIEIESIRVFASTSSNPTDDVYDSFVDSYTPVSYSTKEVFFAGKWIDTPFFDWDSLVKGASIAAPAIVTGQYSTIVLEPGWELKILSGKDALLKRKKEAHVSNKGFQNPQAVQLELFTNRFAAIAEEMGAILERTAFSVNVKERKDFSCALLNEKGELIVNAPHIPVHLGSLGLCTRLVMEKVSMEQGDVIITNHPKYGGSHLPDITLIAPVFDDYDQLIGYVANRAHHAEMGGKTPGSMPPDAQVLAEEGVVINLTYLVRGGKVQWDLIEDILMSAAFPSRSVEENLADLKAGLASIRVGNQMLQGLVANHGIDTVHMYMSKLKDYAHDLIKEAIADLGDQIYKAEEFLDDGTRLYVEISITNGAITFDFTGSADVHPGNMNANLSILTSAVIYVLRLLVDEDIPLNEGLMKGVTLKVPHGILNPVFDDDPMSCPAVVGGNTETSQRIVDLLLKAFGLAACSQGSMNNFLFGNDRFGYYETIGGGVGAGKGFDGASAVHQHMTNTKITDPEVLERRYPVVLNRFEVREGSGGKGQRKGGDGIVREYLFREDVQVTTLMQHRKETPYGLAGGENAKVGQQQIIRKDGAVEILEGIDMVEVQAGDRVVIETPGGGGYGTPQ